jgi:uncharacterized protein (DUF1800 family)
MLRFATFRKAELVYGSPMDNITAQAMIRFGLGARPDQPAPADARGWLHSQLQGADPGLSSGRFDDLPTGADALIAFRSDAMTRKQLQLAGTPLRGNFMPETPKMYQADAKAQLLWAVDTPSPFRERLVWFWANHFSISVRQGGTLGLVGPFIREAIRPHVTGKFTDMVLAVESHPAMLRYLSNVGSVGPNSPAGLRMKRGLNENLGRECMELHTVSLAAGYTQTDVTNMAKLLTGWSVDPNNQPTGFAFRPFAHEPGGQTVLGRRFGGGQQGAIDALTYLSTYPTTYQALARKLVRHFVADDPPADAVRTIATVLSTTQGDLGAAAAALLTLPEAWQPGQKVKTPVEYVVSVLRAAPPQPGDEPPLLPVLNKLGQPLWAAPLPNGWSDKSADWVGSDAVLSRIDWSYNYAERVQAAQPIDVASQTLGAHLRPQTASAIKGAGSPQEGLTLLFASPEFQRR